MSNEWRERVNLKGLILSLPSLSTQVIFPRKWGVLKLLSTRWIIPVMGLADCHSIHLLKEAISPLFWLRCQVLFHERPNILRVCPLNILDQKEKKFHDTRKISCHSSSSSFNMFLFLCFLFFLCKELNHQFSRQDSIYWCREFPLHCKKCSFFFNVVKAVFKFWYLQIKNNDSTVLDPDENWRRSHFLFRRGFKS